MYCVYWIHLKDHDDVYHQGYVGISQSLPERLRAHKKNKRLSHFTYAIRKYGWENLVVDVLYDDLTLEEALSFEKSLRPSNKLGWNSQVGGELGVDSGWYKDEENRLKHSTATSEATKIAIAEKDTKEARSNRARQSWIKNKDSYKNISKGSSNSRAILNEEQVYRIKYELIPSGLSNVEIANLFGVKHYVISFIRSGKNWSHI